MENGRVNTISHAVETKIDTNDIEKALDVAGHGRYSYFVILACCITHLGSVNDMLGYSIVVPAAKCDLNLSLKETGMLTSVSFAGFMFALPWGYYADTHGRKKTLLISTSFGFIFSALSSFSTSFLMMLILKFIGCSFSTSSLMLTTTYLGECIQKKYRSQAIFIQNVFNLASDIVCFGLAYIYLPLDFNIPVISTFQYKPWRLLSLTLSLPLGIGGLLMVFLHESPKFLANQGQTEKALEVLKSTYELNGGCKENYPIKTLIVNERTEEDTPLWQSFVRQTVPIFKPPLLWRTIQLFYLYTICCASNNVFFMWFPTLVNSFYNNVQDTNMTKNFCQRIITNTSISTNVRDENEHCTDTTPMNTIYAGMLFSLFFVAVNIAVIKLASRRKLLLIATFVVAGGGSGLLNLFENQIITMVLFIAIQLTGLCVGPVGSYFVEIYPTSHRGLATSLGMMTARFGCLGGINLIGALIVDHCQPIFYSWAVFVLSGIIAVLFLPSEQKNN